MSRQIGKKRDITILLLGKSGVGKSTFINSFANYAAHSDINYIKTVQDVHAPIPCSFMMSDDDDNEIEFTLGEEKNQDGNESMDPTSSGTRGCKSYSFAFQDVSICLIDTPGIVDTGGVEADKKNLENMLEFISSFKSIDAICILLKPNEERLDTILRYCFLELLSQLDQSAVQNIIFLFTNSRSTLYRLGSTGTSIRQMIGKIKETKPGLNFEFSKETYFMFDSEAFKFLVAKNKIKFDTSERKMFQESWNKSRQECIRLIRKIQTLPSHDVTNMLSIFRTRQLIDALLPLLKIIGGDVIINEEACDLKGEDIRAFQGDISELEKILYIPRIDVKIEHFDNPRIICKSEKCTKRINVGEECKLLHDQICYEAETSIWIKLKGLLENCKQSPTDGFPLVQPQTMASTMAGYSISHLAALAGPLVVGASATTLAAITSAGVIAGTAGLWYLYTHADCPVCQCKYSDHIPTYYQPIKVELKIVDGETKEKILTKENKKAEVDKFFQKLRAEQGQLKDEKEVIDRANNVFAVFLKYRAITPYNDGYEAYLDFLIEQEKHSMDVRKKNRLLEQKKNYKDQKAIIDKAMQSSQNCEEITLQHVEAVVAELKTLNRYGKAISEVIGMKKTVDEFKKANFRQEISIAKTKISRAFFSIFGEDEFPCLPSKV